MSQGQPGVFIDELAPEFVGEPRIVVQLDPSTPTPQAFGVVQVNFDYSGCDPEGIRLPLEFIIQSPSASGFVREILRTLRPTERTFIPKEGGVHLVLLRELGHNQWFGKLNVTVEGDPIDQST